MCTYGVRCNTKHLVFSCSHMSVKISTISVRPGKGVISDKYLRASMSFVYANLLAPSRDEMCFKTFDYNFVS